MKTLCVSTHQHSFSHLPTSVPTRNTQVKVFLMDVALQCLASLEKQLFSLCPDPSVLHMEARTLIRRFFQQQQTQEGGGSGTDIVLI